MKRIRFIAMLCAVTMMVIGTLSTVSAAGQPETMSLVIKLINGLTSVEQKAVIDRNGGIETSSIPALRLHVIAVPTADLPLTQENYQFDPQVESVELNKTRKAEGIPGDLSYGVQWALAKIGWESAFGTVIPSGSAKLAILDTGVDASHPDLSSNIISGTSILNGTNGLSDPNGHGTSLAGIVAALTDNSEGIAGISYAGVRIMPVTVLDTNGVGLDSDIIAGIIWAADNGADVILMGFSNPDFSQNLQDAIDYAWSKGAVMVAATGNDGVNTPTFPAGNRGVVGVSATDQNDALYVGSNYGQQVFLAAPGTDIYTTSLGNSYGYISGTSASSAIVAGVAAFMKAVDPSLTNGVIVGRLASSADAIGTLDDPNNPVMFGNGRVNMANALADIGIDEVQPSGASPVGSGGPYVGPYVAACHPEIALSPNTGPPDTVVNASGSLHGNKKIITIKYDGTTVATTPSICITEPGGSFSCRFTVPTGTTGKKTVTSTTSQASASVTFTQQTVAKSPQVITVDTPSPPVSSYGSTFNVAAHSNSGLAVAITASGSCSGSGSSTGISSPVAVSITSGSGLCTVKYDQAGNSSFNPATQVTSSTNVTTRPITITADAKTKTYGAADPALTFQTTGLVNGDVISVVLTRAPGENVGSYAITQVTPVASDNYDVTYVSANLTITKAAATITADAKTKTYGAADPALTFQTTGLVNGDVISVVLTRAPGENVGSYAITQVTPVASDNYDVTYVSANLAITKAAATITADAKTKTYGATDPALTFQTTGLVNGDIISVVLTRAPGENAGSYAITQVTPVASDNYDVTYVSANLTITKASIIITWATPADINNMTPLSSTQLNAVASVPGTPEYTPAPGAILGTGNKTLSVIFTPNDAVNYNIASATVTINVIPVPPCGAPSYLTVPTNNTTGTMTIYFGSSNCSGATYILEQSVNGTDYTQVYSGTYKSKSITVTTNGTYTYRVKAAKSGYADSEFTTGSNTCNVALKCGAPAYLTVPATNTTGTMTIYFGSSDVTGVTYILEQKFNDGPYTIVYSGTSTSSRNITVTADGTYTYRISAIKSGYANSDYTTTNSCNVALKCGAPAYLTVPANNSTGSMAVYFGSSDVSGVTYILEQKFNDGQYILVYSGTSTSRTLTVTADGSYTYRVSAIKNGYADSDYTTTNTCNVSLKCGTPSYLTVPATNATGTINVTWGTSDVSGVTYVLQQSGNGSEYNTVYSGTSVYANITVPTNGTYIYKVKAIKAGYADSDYTTTNSCSAALKCGAPASLTVPDTNTTGTINVSWGTSNVSGVTYVLERSNDNGENYTLVYSGTSSYKNSITMAANGTYIYRVKAIKSGYADSDYTTTNSCSVTLKCGAPASLTVPDTNTTGTINVTWGTSSISGVTYVLERSNDNGENYTLVYSGTSSYKNSITMAVNGTYIYRVKAIKAGYTDSDYTTTNTCSVTLSCGAPTSLTVPATNTTGIVYVTWGTSNVSGVTYTLEQSSDNGESYTTVYSGTSLYKNNTVPNGIYTYRVKATKAGYTSSEYTYSAVSCTVTK